MFTALTRSLAGGAAVAGLVASGLIAPSAAGAAGTLTLDPTSGNGAFATISATTSGGCGNANATHYVVTMTGSGLDAPINMVGLTPLTSIGSSGTSTDPMGVDFSKSFDDVKNENGGSLPSGGYTLTFTCRAKVNPAPLNTFTAPVTITTIPGGLTWTTEGAEEPTIMIQGSRTQIVDSKGKTRKGVLVEGMTTGFAEGDIVRPWYRLPGQDSDSQGLKRIRIDADGEFTWQRAGGKKIYITIRSEDGSIKSNRLKIN